MMINISQYIKENENLKNLDFATVYLTIFTLLEDKRLKWDFDENVYPIQPEPV